MSADRRELGSRLQEDAMLYFGEAPPSRIAGVLERHRRATIR